MEVALAQSSPAVPTPTAKPRIDAALLVLLAIPLGFIALDRSFFINFDGGIDNWLYEAFQWHLPELLRTFHYTYYSTRLTAILPGWVLHQILPPIWAEYVGHIGVHWVGVASLYLTLRMIVGRRPAFLAGLCMNFAPYYLMSTGWSYVDGYGVAYFLLCIYCLTRAARSEHWRTWMVVAGFVGGALVVANTLYVTFVPFLGLWSIAVNRDGFRRNWIAGAAWFLLGALLLFSGLSTFNWFVAGKFWFMSGVLQLTWAFAVKTTPEAAFVPYGSWMFQRAYLIWPAACAVSCIATLLAARLTRKEHRPSVAFQALQVMLPLHLALFVCLDLWRGYLLLQIFFTTALTIPAVFLALGGQFKGITDRLSPGAYRSICGLLVLMFVLSILVPKKWIVNGPVDLEKQTLGYLPLAGVLLFGLLLLRLPGRWRLGPAPVAVSCVVAIGLTPIFPLENVFRVYPRISNSAVRAHYRAAGDRLDNYRAVREAASHIWQEDPTAHVWCWYNIHEPGGGLFDCVASTQFHAFRMFGQTFPKPPEPGCGGLDAVRAGRKLVVLSNEPTSTATATQALSGLGVNARVVRVVCVEHPRRFYMTFLQANPPAVAASR